MSIKRVLHTTWILAKYLSIDAKYLKLCDLLLITFPFWSTGSSRQAVTRVKFHVLVLMQYDDMVFDLYMSSAH